jgi:hypothetical protein
MNILIGKKENGLKPQLMMIYTMNLQTDYRKSKLRKNDAHRMLMVRDFSYGFLNCLN